MSTHSQLLVRSLKLSSALLLVTIVITLLLARVVPVSETFGDLLLIETAILFLLAGLIDFGSSLAFVQFKKSFRSSREPFSLEQRKRAERRGLVLLASGVTFLAILILMAILGAW